MEAVKATLGLGMRSVADVKSVFFIFPNDDFFNTIIRLLSIGDRLWSAEDEYKKVRFIKNTDKSRHEMN